MAEIFTLIAGGILLVSLTMIIIGFGALIYKWKDFEK